MVEPLELPASDARLRQLCERERAVDVDRAGCVQWLVEPDVGPEVVDRGQVGREVRVLPGSEAHPLLLEVALDHPQAGAWGRRRTRRREELTPEGVRALGGRSPAATPDQDRRRGRWRPAQDPAQQLAADQAGGTRDQGRRHGCSMVSAATAGTGRV